MVHYTEPEILIYAPCVHIYVCPACKIDTHSLPLSLIVCGEYYNSQKLHELSQWWPALTHHPRHCAAESLAKNSLLVIKVLGAIYRCMQMWRWTPLRENVWSHSPMGHYRSYQRAHVKRSLTEWMKENSGGEIQGPNVTVDRGGNNKYITKHLTTRRR